MTQIGDDVGTVRTLPLLLTYTKHISIDQYNTVLGLILPGFFSDIFSDILMKYEIP